MAENISKIKELQAEIRQFSNERKEEQNKFRQDDTLDKIKYQLAKIDPLFKNKPDG